jgi:TRAP-type mannitol/chloroaromatic compound transport system substrate-binding protein
MSNPVGSVTQAQAAVPVSDVREKAPEPRAQPIPTDQVQLSSAAQAALEEATETQAQTAKEASAGDAQARRLLAKQEASKADAVREEAQTTTHVVA